MNYETITNNKKKRNRKKKNEIKNQKYIINCEKKKCILWDFMLYISVECPCVFPMNNIHFNKLLKN